MKHARRKVHSTPFVPIHHVPGQDNAPSIPINHVPNQDSAQRSRKRQALPWKDKAADPEDRWEQFDHCLNLEHDGREQREHCLDLEHDGWEQRDHCLDLEHE
ncbi:hypothetical protein V6N12_003369 [Hibiscus sabdariffa]|uniref:Uncharacterized protein n=1 Tax=Hibiscus sabdariffa TaxID=183260 RepID=A0ABR2B586_9ROSI